MLGLGLLGGTLGGALGALMVFLRLRQRCTSLEWAVGDLQTRASSFKGKEMAEKRWRKADLEAEELARVMQNAPAASRRYDNDPLGG